MCERHADRHSQREGEGEKHTNRDRERVSERKRALKIKGGNICFQL